MYFERGGEDVVISREEMKAGLFEALGRIGERKKVLAIPPDITRFYSRAGDLTVDLVDYYGDAVTDIMPALGTHTAMTEPEMDRMFPGVSHDLFREHKWRTDLTTLGRGSRFIHERSLRRKTGLRMARPGEYPSGRGRTRLGVFAGSGGTA